MNKYVFNWNAVLAHCPEYKKYLVDVESLQDDVEKKIVPEVYNSWIDNLDRTDEELEVIKQMSGEKDIQRSVHRLISDEQERSVEVEKEIVYTLNPIYLKQPLPTKMNPLQLLPPKCVLDAGSEMFFPGETGWHMSYKIAGNEHHDGSVNMVKTKVNETEDKIQLVRAFYWFNQSKNVMRDRSGRFKCLTYNKKTRCLYYVYRTPKKGGVSKKSKRYKSNVRGILLDKMALSTAISGIDQIMLKSFVDIVEKAVSKDVSDAYIPGPSKSPKPQKGVRIVVDALVLRDLDAVDFLRTKLLVLLLQHKANVRLDWLNYNVLNNIGELLTTTNFAEHITGKNESIHLEQGKYAKRCAAEHKSRVRKVVPALRSKRSLKGLTKAVCGEFYSQILVKLMSAVDVDTQTWINLLQAIHYGFVPKFLYHWLNNVLSNGVEGEELPEKVIHEILLTMNDVNSPIEPTHTRNITTVNLWVKTCKRFISQSGYIVSWFTWRDMYNMADRMNIRLRPNKLIDSDDVQRQHDLLTELTNRDRSMLRDYADVVFREFAIPDKEYDGFTFVQLQTTEELVHEGQTMHHCVGGYSNRCVSGKSILFSMRKGTRSYVTIELDGTTFPCSIRQQYTIDDVCVTSEFALELINKWLEDVRELHNEDKLTYAQECKNVVDKIKTENRLQKLTELKAEAVDETLTHINNECAKLEQQLATLAMGSTQHSAPQPPYTDTEIDLLIDDIREVIAHQVGGA